MSKEEQKYFKGLIGFTFDSDDIRYIEKIVDKKDKEIERLNNIIKELEKENQDLKEKTKLFHKNRVFSLEYDKETLTDMVLEYQEKIDKAIEYITTFKNDIRGLDDIILIKILEGKDNE